MCHVLRAPLEFLSIRQALSGEHQKAAQELSIVQVVSIRSAFEESL